MQAGFSFFGSEVPGIVSSLNYFTYTLSWMKLFHRLLGRSLMPPACVSDIVLHLRHKSNECYNRMCLVH